MRVYGLKALPPALGLVDLYGDTKGWQPQADDLDIPQKAQESVLKGSRLLGVKLPQEVQEALQR